MNKTKLPFIFGIFTLSLLLLLINDYYLKQAFHNTVTGKLSDFAGLLIFPWFWSLVLKKHGPKIYLATAFFFVFWKLEISSSFILAINQNLGFNFSRVVDFTDLWALLILPLSYQLYLLSQNSLHRLPGLLKNAIALISVFAFLATSQPQIFVEPNWDFNQSYSIPFSKEELLTKQMNYRNTNNTDSTMLKESNFRVNYFGGTYDFTFNANITSLDSSTTNFILLKLIDYSIRGVSNEKKDGLDKQKFLEIFDNEVISDLKRPVTDYSLFNYSEIE